MRCKTVAFDSGATWCSLVTPSCLFVLCILFKCVCNGVWLKLTLFQFKLLHCILFIRFCLLTNLFSLYYLGWLYFFVLFHIDAAPLRSWDCGLFIFVLSGFGLFGWCGVGLNYCTFGFDWFEVFFCILFYYGAVKCVMSRHNSKERNLLVKSICFCELFLCVLDFLFFVCVWPVQGWLTYVNWLTMPIGLIHSHW